MAYRLVINNEGFSHANASSFKQARNGIQATLPQNKILKNDTNAS